jgi:hypothetical protein
MTATDLLIVLTRSGAMVPRTLLNIHHTQYRLEYMRGARSTRVFYLNLSFCPTCDARCIQPEV